LKDATLLLLASFILLFNRVGFFCFAGGFLFAYFLFNCLYVAKLFATSDCSPGMAESAVI